MLSPLLIKSEGKNRSTLQLRDRSEKAFRKVVLKSIRLQDNSTIPARFQSKGCKQVWSNYDERKSKADTLREQYEQAELQRKFLLIHRREINKQHVYRKYLIRTGRNCQEKAARTAALPTEPERVGWPYQAGQNIPTHPSPIFRNSAVSPYLYRNKRKNS